MGRKRRRTLPQEPAVTADVVMSALLRDITIMSKVREGTVRSDGRNIRRFMRLYLGLTVYVATSNHYFT